MTVTALQMSCGTCARKSALANSLQNCFSSRNVLFGMCSGWAYWHSIQRDRLLLPSSLTLFPVCRVSIHAAIADGRICEDSFHGLSSSWNPMVQLETYSGFTSDGVQVSIFARPLFPHS